MDTKFRASTTDIPLTACPPLLVAAEMIGVHRSSLTRRQLDSTPMGDRDKRLRPIQVMQEADHFKRKHLTEVAAALITYAYAHAPTAVSLVEEEVDAYLDGVSTHPRLTSAEFLSLIKATLPVVIYDAVEHAIRSVADHEVEIVKARETLLDHEGGGPEPFPTKGAAQGKTH